MCLPFIVCIWLLALCGGHIIKQINAKDKRYFFFNIMASKTMLNAKSVSHHATHIRKL